jgi:hypothetical protein
MCMKRIINEDVPCGHLRRDSSPNSFSYAKEYGKGQAGYG